MRGMEYVSITTENGIILNHNIYKEVWNNPLHIHDDVEIDFIESGSGSYTINGQCFPFGVGDVALINPGNLHVMNKDVTADLDFWTLHVPMQLFCPSKTIFNRKNVTPVAFPGFHGAFLHAAFCEMEYMAKTYNNAALIGPYRCMTSVISGVLHDIYRSVPDVEYPLSPDRRIVEIAKYLFENFTSPITLADIGDRFYISPSHLSAEFSKIFGVSPINYVIDLRFREARRLLYESDEDIKVIAKRVGYSNVQHFNNLFLKRIGILPSEYRARFKFDHLEGLEFDWDS